MAFKPFKINDFATTTQATNGMTTRDLIESTRNFNSVITMNAKPFCILINHQNLHHCNIYQIQNIKYKKASNLKFHNMFNPTLSLYTIKTINKWLRLLLYTGDIFVCSNGFKFFIFNCCSSTIVKFNMVNLKPLHGENKFCKPSVN